MSKTNVNLVVLILFLDGLIKPDTPGSLREPAQTYLFPENWLTLPLSFGILICTQPGVPSSLPFFHYDHILSTVLHTDMSSTVRRTFRLSIVSISSILPKLDVLTSIGSIEI